MLKNAVFASFYIKKGVFLAFFSLLRTDGSLNAALRLLHTAAYIGAYSMRHL
jgi:hypothetical protein